MNKNQYFFYSSQSVKKVVWKKKNPVRIFNTGWMWCIRMNKWMNKWVNEWINGLCRIAAVVGLLSEETTENPIGF